MKPILSAFIVPTVILGRVPTQAEPVSKLHRDFRGASLLMGPPEVKKALKAAGFRVKVRSSAGTKTTLPSYSLRIRKPEKGFLILSFNFYETKLGLIHAEYDLDQVPIDFELFLRDLTRQYGPPTETRKETPLQLPGFEDLTTSFYFWRDSETEFEVSYSPPFTEPLSKGVASGNIQWRLSDRVLMERHQRESEAKNPAIKEERERAIRRKMAEEEQHRFLEHLENPPQPYEKGRALFAAHCDSCHAMGGVPALKRRGRTLLLPQYQTPRFDDEWFYKAVRDGAKQFWFSYGDMPSIPGLSNDDMREIVRYVRWAQAEENARNTQ